MHLKPEELIDVAEGAVVEASFPHLASCAACRTELTELRAALGSVEGLGSVPEPPPFFFDRFQHRVAAAVAADADRGRFSRIFATLRPAIGDPLTALAAVAVLALVLSVGRLRPAPTAPASPAVVADSSSSPTLDNASDAIDQINDDPSLELVADLASGMDAAAAREAGFAPNGSAEHALTHLSASELQELKQLLRAELGT